MSNASTEQQRAQQMCKHQRTQVIAKDNQAEYIECLDCGAILDIEELTPSAAAEPDKPETNDESLSDA